MESENTKSKIQEYNYWKNNPHIWYFRKYIIPLNEISILILLNILGLCFFLVIFGNVVSLFPLAKSYRIFLESNKFDYKNIKFFHISTNKDIENSFFNLLVKNYIEKVEFFSINQVKKQINFILNNSSESVTQNFLHYISNSNSESPVLRYAHYYVKKVNILNLENLSDNKVRAYIETQTFNRNQELAEKLIYEIQLKFDSDFSLLKNHYESNKINFKVIEYSRKLLKADIY